MVNTSKNLKNVLEYYNISNSMLAKALNIDASLVSRWINGKRQLRASSDILSKLADYILEKSSRLENIEWLKKQFARDDIVFKFLSVNELKQGLIMWLASDGDKLRSAFGGKATVIPSQENADKAPDGKALVQDNDYIIKAGRMDIALYLEKLLLQLNNESMIDIHLSNEDALAITNEAISKMLIKTMSEKNTKVRLLITLSSNTMAMSRIISMYLQPIVEANLNISVVHGMTQAITNQTTFIIDKKCVMLISETPKSSAVPIAAITYEEGFVKDTEKSFEKAYNYSQSLLQRYNDNYSRNILEILYHEFAMPGNLDIIKDSLNPMYMSLEEYDRFLRSCGHKGEQFRWRSAEFVRFKSGMEENLKNGTVFREILSLKRLNQIAEDGQCKMPALYFMNRGIVHLDAKGCASIFEGYIQCLKTIPSFNLMILDEISELNENNCWQLKQNSHIALNGWDQGEHIILYSNQLMLTHEFQIYFNSIWDKANYSEGMRNQSIAILSEVAKKLKANHLS